MNGTSRIPAERRSARPVLLDAPDWPALTTDELAAFAEAINTLLDSGIFRPPLAAELARYRDNATAEITGRIADIDRKLQASRAKKLLTVVSLPTEKDPA